MRYATADERSQVEAIRAEAARRMAELREAPPFRVLAVTGPVPKPAWFAEGHRSDNVWQRITLRHGRLGRDAAAVWVISAVRDAEPMSLAESLRLERDGYRQAGADPAAEEPARGRVSRADLVVDGAVLVADVLTEGTWWAARIALDTVVVTVVGHRVPLIQVQLATVADLGRHLDAREAELARGQH